MRWGMEERFWFFVLAAAQSGFSAPAAQRRRPAITNPCLPNDGMPKARPGCTWEHIIDPLLKCPINWQCRPKDLKERGAPACPEILRPTMELRRGLQCDWEPVFDKNGLCISHYRCANLPEEELDFREYYLGPYYRPKHLYPAYPPGWKGGYGVRFYPKEFRYLVE